MADFWGQLRERTAGKPGWRFGSAAAFGAGAALVGLLFFSKLANGVATPNPTVGALVIAFFVVCALGIALNHAWAWVTAQYVGGLMAIWTVVLFLRERSSSPPEGGPHAKTLFLALTFVFAGLVFLATVARPKSPPVPERAPGTGPPPRDPDALDWTRDNIEAIVVAFLMALIIRCFCIEVFKIPTGSMEPTLLGDTKPEDQLPHHEGDRIMVDKLGLVFEGVHRFDVCVFKYPLDRSRNFIKRLVGLPDEDIMIDNGDLWTRPHTAKEDGAFRIARKPLKDQVGIWLTAWPGGDTTADRCQRQWSGAPTACYLGDNVYDTGPAKGAVTFRTDSRVTGQYKGKGHGGLVYDLRWKCAVTFSEGKGEVFIRNARGDGYGDFEARIDAAGKVSLVHDAGRDSRWKPGTPIPAPVQLGAIAPGTEIELANFDGAARVLVGGREVLAWEYVDEIPQDVHSSDAPAFQQSFGARDGAVRFERVTVGRDIYYYSESGAFEGREFLTIPPSRYLAIGDNVGNSKDSRLWKERHLKLKNGLTIVADYDSSDHYPSEAGHQPDGSWRIRDLDGTDHFFREEDIEDDGSGKHVNHPFIAREELVGKALIVWWPLPRFKLIR